MDISRDTLKQIIDLANLVTIQHDTNIKRTVDDGLLVSTPEEVQLFALIHGLPIIQKRELMALYLVGREEYRDISEALKSIAFQSSDAITGYLTPKINLSEFVTKGLRSGYNFNGEENNGDVEWSDAGEE